VPFISQGATIKLCFIDEHTTKRVRLTEAGHTGGSAALAAEPSPYRCYFWRMNMNAKKLIAAAAVFTATGSVFAAQTYPYVDFSGFQGSNTRAQVVAELKDAQAQGSYIVGGSEFAAPAEHFASTKTRAQVVAELQQSQADGSYAVLQEEYEGQVPALGGNTGTRLAQNARPAHLD